MRKRVLRYLFEGAVGKVFRGMISLALGSGMGRAIGLAAIPMLARIYSPEDFGALAIFVALTSILAPLATLRYAMALPLPRQDGIAINLLVLSIALVLIFSILVGVLLWLAGNVFLGLFSMGILAPWWWLIVLGILVTSLYELLRMWAIRRRKYKTIAGISLVESASNASVKITLGLLLFKPLGLLLGQAIGLFFGMVSMLAVFARDFSQNRRHVRWGRIQKVSLRYRHFPVYRMPSQLLTNLSMQSPILCVAVLYGAETAGQLGLAFSAISLPVALLGRTMATAFYAEAADITFDKPNEIKSLFASVTSRLGLIAIAPAIVLLLFGKLIFVIVFGAEWELAGTFASIMAIYMLFQFMQAPVAYAFILFEGHKPLLFIGVQRLFLSGSVFFCAQMFSLSSQEAIILYVIFISIHFSVSIAYAHRHISERIRLGK